MENVYDIRKEEELYFILSSNRMDAEVCLEIIEKTAVIVCLYYENTLSKYYKYLRNIPKQVDIYVISSNKKVLDIINEDLVINEKRNINLISKENRGRDISALLVAAQGITRKYQYFCFIHDKREKTVQRKNLVETWIDNLWENCLGSTQYILNILNTFETNKNIGILAPPEPLGAFMDFWGENFEQTEELARRLQIVCDINRSKQPITLGTAFWCKRNSLEKILDYPWCYTDFDAEPLKNDGTISHAIERIFAYVAQDAGYKTGTVMAIRYAEHSYAYYEFYANILADITRKKYGIMNCNEINDFYFIEKKVQLFCKTYSEIYLYGAGLRGKQALCFLTSCGYTPNGFVVSKKVQNEKNLLNGYKIYQLDEIEINQSVGIIISVGIDSVEDIQELLESRGIKNYLPIWKI